MDLSGAMTVDAFYKSAGIKLRTNAYTSGAVEARSSIRGSHLANLSLSLPNDKMDVLSFRSNIVLIQGNGAETTERAIGQPINRRRVIGATMKADTDIFDKYPAKNIIKNTTCSWSALDRLIGLKLCSDYQFPNVTHNLNSSYLILHGPTLLKLSLIKADLSAKSYLLEYKWDRTEVVFAI